MKKYSFLAKVAKKISKMEKEAVAKYINRLYNLTVKVADSEMEASML